MYSTYNGVLEKNQMFTPPTIGLTSSIVNDKLNSISLNDNNSSELFTINETDTAIQTKNNIPLEASQFVITGTNEEIDADENNAVNKRYLSTKINSLEDKYFLKSNIINKDQDPSNETVYSSLSTHTLLEEKANIDDVYNKDEIDNKLLDYPMKNTVYDKAYINTNYYNTTVVDSNFMSFAKNLISATAKPTNDTTYNSLATQELLAEKANTSDVYNKTEIDNKISTINSNIDLKADKTDVYNKTEVDGLFNGYIKLLAPKQNNTVGFTENAPIIGNSVALLSDGIRTLSYREEYANCDKILYNIFGSITIKSSDGTAIDGCVKKIKSFHVADDKGDIYPLTFNITSISTSQASINYSGLVTQFPLKDTTADVFSLYYFSEEGLSSTVSWLIGFTIDRYAIKF